MSQRNEWSAKAATGGTAAALRPGLLGERCPLPTSGAVDFAEGLSIRPACDHALP